MPVETAMTRNTQLQTAYDAFAVTPSDTLNFTNLAKALYVGGAGDVALVTSAGGAATFVGVPAGTVLPVKASRVNATGTTAANIIGLL